VVAKKIEKFFLTKAQIALELVYAKLLGDYGLPKLTG
jgi:hypothetical protein